MQVVTECEDESLEEVSVFGGVNKKICKLILGTGSPINVLRKESCPGRMLSQQAS